MTKYMKKIKPNEYKTKKCSFCDSKATFKEDSGIYSNRMFCCDEHRQELRDATDKRMPLSDYESEGERYAKNLFGGSRWGL